MSLRNELDKVLKMLDANEKAISLAEQKVTNIDRLADALSTRVSRHTLRLRKLSSRRSK